MTIQHIQYARRVWSIKPLLQVKVPNLSIQAVTLAPPEVNQEKEIEDDNKVDQKQDMEK